MSDRISIDEYYLKMALAASERADCDRAKVGALIINDDIILGTGYNGSLPKQKHCDGATCQHSGNCIRTVHAEVNALERAIRAGWYDKLAGSTIYTTHRPCYSCAKTLSAFKIMNVVFNKMYNDEKAEAYFKLVGMNVKQVNLGTV